MFGVRMLERKCGICTGLFTVYWFYYGDYFVCVFFPMTASRVNDRATSAIDPKTAGRAY